MMRVAQRPLFLLLFPLLAVAAACGNKVGDGCNQASDCSAEGERTCDLTSPGGYCTIVGCDYGTCPGESVCVRFFVGLDFAATCTTQADCGIDEHCTVSGKCAA